MANKRNTLNEVEKFYINYHYTSMTIEQLIEKLTAVSPNAIKAYILNLPSPLKDTTPEKPIENQQKPQDRHSSFITTLKGKTSKQDITSQFAKREGIAIMTQAASESSDQVNPMRDGK